MSDELYERFRICQTDGLLGLTEEQVLEKVKEFGQERRDQDLDCYNRVIQDPVLKSLLPEVDYYDLDEVSIKQLYGDRKREMQRDLLPSGEEPNQKVEEKQPSELVDSTSSFVSGAKDLQEKIANAPGAVENNVPAEQMPEVPEISKEDIQIDPQQTDEMYNTVQKQNARALSKKLNQVGYANIVLMSIIVIIIVAIICVFIFM